MHNKESRKSVNRYSYCADKYWTRNFLNFIEPITTDWGKDYTVDICDGFEWNCSLKYNDGSTKVIKGNVILPPFTDDIERRIRNLATFEVAPWLFT